ncbi:MAG: Flp pilus assembly complex ATPase component TadA [Candidatus Margulisbacteria bacterium]|nr:Flp pilus assembly complex ATPase component TadA [Candidatus Margulisiibacteriota bacterium]
MSKKKDIRELLVSSGLLTRDQVKDLVEEGRKTGASLLSLIYQRKLLDEATVSSFLEDKLEIPRVDLSRYLIDQKTLDSIPASTVKKYGIIPLFLVEKTLSVATADPFNVKAIDEVRSKAGLDVEIMVATPSDIKQAVSQYYGVAGTLEEVLEQVSAPENMVAGGPALEEEAPVTKLVNLLLAQALSERASDIHIEPEESKVRVRYRIDGIMYEVSAPPRHLHAPIVSRIKVMSRMDISETRLPQDGRFEFSFEGRPIDVRVSSYPSIYGEALVLRLLDKQSMMFGLEDLGFSSDNLKKFEEIIKRPYGIILVTGPTGSGKTTSLYATLNRINSPVRNIITIEDPVEYELPGIRQSQVNPKAGLVFANALRSILRQDPDVILVGEIRDLETANVAIESALTGHLVFSTLHTNDAAGALSRLQDMGVEKFLISSACAAVIAQRLVRKICPVCKVEVDLPKEYQGKFEAFEQRGIKKVFEGKGCKSCRNTGYRGRSGIFEILEVTERIREMILEGKSAMEIKKEGVKEGMRTLRDDGLIKVMDGKTTIEEMLRVTLLD